MKANLLTKKDEQQLASVISHIREVMVEDHDQRAMRLIEAERLLRTVTQRVMWRARGE